MWGIRVPRRRYTSFGVGGRGGGEVWEHGGRSCSEGGVGRGVVGGLWTLGAPMKHGWVKELGNARNPRMFTE